MNAEVSEILEITLAKAGKAYEAINTFDYCENIAENLRIHELIREEHCERIRSSKTPEDKNE